MIWNRRIRQTHRWLSIAFTLCVVANFVINLAFGDQEQLALWVGMATLVPLFALLISGLYLFVLPYTSKGRGT